MALRLFAGTKLCENCQKSQQSRNLIPLIFNSFKYEWFYDLSSFSFIPKGFFNRFYICVASSNSIEILMETQFYKKADLLLKIVSVNQISIKQEIRFFTNKLISWKPSFIIVSARYPKFMIKSWKFFWTLLGSFLLKMLRETSLKITDVINFLSIFFFLYKLQRFIYINGKEVLCWFNSADKLCRENFYFSRYKVLNDCYLHPSS